ncbi:MAG: PepSY-like domain-containing protein [Alloprevotella sp.]
MKSLLACLCCMWTAIACADNEKPIQVSELPAPAQQLLTQHFSDEKVALAKAESEFLSKSYEVIFVSGNHIDFDSKGNWEEIDCPKSAVPAALIPEAIRDYVAKNYPDTAVLKIERDRWKYEVKLDNRIELAFNLKFQLIDIDS